MIALVIEPIRSPNYPVPSTAPVELAPNYYYDTRQWSGTTSNATSALSIASRNQLPPQVKVTMVAIDEVSAARMQAQYGGALGSTLPTFSDSSTSKPALTGGLYNANGTSNLFLTASQTPGDNKTYQSDLTSLEQALVNLHVTYRVFSTNVTILQAKFSD